jgi:hypothetical protein
MCADGGADLSAREMSSSKVKRPLWRNTNAYIEAGATD